MYKTNLTKHLFNASLMLVLLFAYDARSQERDIRIAKEFSGRRVALVMGNSAYEPVPLKNPINDARKMAEALYELGFEVTLKEDLNLIEMKRAISRFGEELRKVALDGDTENGVYTNELLAQIRKKI